MSSTIKITSPEEEVEVECLNPNRTAIGIITFVKKKEYDYPVARMPISDARRLVRAEERDCANNIRRQVDKRKRREKRIADGAKLQPYEVGFHQTEPNFRHAQPKPAPKKA